MRKSSFIPLLCLLVLFFVLPATECDPFNDLLDDSNRTAAIGPEGGFVRYSDDYFIYVPPGTYDETVQITLTPVNIPDDPTRLRNVDVFDAFHIKTQTGTNQRRPIEMYFKYPKEDIVGPRYAYYRYTYGEGLEFCTNVRDSQNLFKKIKMRGFSYWTLGELADTDRPIYLLNQGSVEADVFVYNYELTGLETDIPITENAGAICHIESSTSSQDNICWLELGSYQFCAQWIDEELGDEHYQMRHRFVGNPPPDFSYTLTESSSMSDPQKVYINTDYEGSLPGPCPCTITQWDNIDILGYWNGTFTNDWGQTRLYIGFDTWTFSTESSSFSYEIVEQDYVDDGYIIGKKIAGSEYRKIMWNYIDEDQINLSILIACLSLEEAKSNSSMDILPAEFTKE